MNVLITGGSGSLGRVLVKAAVGAGHVVRVMSRGARPTLSPDGVVRFEWAQADIASGEGVPAAVDRIDAIIHAASDPRRAEAVDVGGTRKLVDAARDAGVGHLVYISIVGIDDIPLHYYNAKRTAEEIIGSSTVPFSILRATQFHSFVDTLLSMAARLPFVLPLPTDFKCQSITKREVAERLVQCVAAVPQKRLINYGGPEILTLGEMAEMWKAARGVRKTLIQLPVPGAIGKAFRAGKNTAPIGVRGKTPWNLWLKEAVDARAAVRNAAADPGGGR